MGDTATTRWAIQPSFICAQDNTANASALAPARFLVPAPPSAPPAVDALRTRLASFFPRPFAERYYFLMRIETTLKLLLFLADKMPYAFAEALSDVAEGASISSAGASELIKRLMIEVDAHYFPLFPDWEMVDEIEFSKEIPIMVFGVSSDELDGVFDSLIVLYFAVYSENLYPMDIDIFEPDDIAAIFPQDDEDGGNVQRIKDRLKALPAGHPARGALATLRLIERDDANTFISCSYMDGNNDSVWDDDWFDRLTADWREAKPVIEAHIEFIEWLRGGLYKREEAFIRYIGGTIDELDENIYPREV